MSAVGVAEALWEGAGARWAEQKNSNGRGPSSADRPGGRGYGAVGVASAGPSGAALGWDRPPSLESESARDAPGRAPGLSAQKFPARAPGGRAAGSGRRAGRPLPPPGLARGRGVGAPPRPLAGDKARAPAGPSEICRPEEPALQAGAPGDPRKNWGWLAQCGVQLPGQRWGPSPPLLCPPSPRSRGRPLAPPRPGWPLPGIQGPCLGFPICGTGRAEPRRPRSRPPRRLRQARHPLPGRPGHSRTHPGTAARPQAPNSGLCARAALVAPGGVARRAALPRARPKLQATPARGSRDPDPPRSSLGGAATGVRGSPRLHPRIITVPDL